MAEPAKASVLIGIALFRVRIYLTGTRCFYYSYLNIYLQENL